MRPTSCQGHAALAALNHRTGAPRAILGPAHCSDSIERKKMSDTDTTYSNHKSTRRIAGLDTSNSMPENVTQLGGRMPMTKLSLEIATQALRFHTTLKNRPAQLILTRSSIMPGDFGDFQLPYLKYILDFIGITDVRVITAWQTTKTGIEERQAYIDSFTSEATEAARRF